MYFIHNKFDEESQRILASLDNDTVVVDYYADPDRFKRIKGLQKIPCFMERLEFEEESIFTLNRKVAELDTILAKTNAELADLKAKQAAQETMLIECFTDLDASINGGDQDAELV